MLLVAASLFFFPAYEVTRSPGYGTSLFADIQGNAYVVSSTTNTTSLSKVDRDGRLVYRIPVGASYAYVEATTLDSANNVYAVVDSLQTYLMKIDPTGKVLFRSPMPYFYFHALSVGPDGSIYLTGEGDPKDLQTTPGAWITSAQAAPDQDNAAVVKMSADGSRTIFATFLDHSPPGSSNVTVAGTAITVDAAGNVYVAGHNFDSHFATTPGALQTQCCANDTAAAFVVKLNPQGTAPIYSTFLPVGDMPTSIRVDAEGNAELTVNTSGTASPSAVNTLQLSAAGNRVSNLVSTSLDRLHLVAPNPISDGAGNILVTGETVPADLPGTPDALNNGDNFIAVLRASDGALLYSSRLPNGAAGIGIVPDGSGGFIVLGTGADPGYIDADCVPGVECPARGPFSMLTRFTPTFLPRPSILAVTNTSAAIVSWGVAPGEIVNIYGIELGPEHSLSASYLNGSLPFELGGTQVYFNGISAPILRSGNNLVTAVVPFQVSPEKQVTVQLRFNTVETNLAELPGISRDLEIFRGLDPQLPNYDFAYAVNEDGEPNSADNPAKAGSIVSIFVNGAGLLTPEPPDGVAQPIGPVPLLPVSVSFGGFSEPEFYVPCEVLYAGAAPKQVAGKVQINFRVPAPQTAPEVNNFALVQVSIGDQQAKAQIWRERQAP
jgi:uncharacterized protein (TIGR03437 family)